MSSEYIKPITLSSILDCVYCKRRYYLRIVEQQNESRNNIYMEMGRQEHQDVDKSTSGFVNGIYTMTNVLVHSDKYNLIGICDMIEFVESYDGISCAYTDYPVDIVPVEFKHGRSRHCNEYIMQVVAQSVCLEEMYSCKINYGYIYYVDSDERVRVGITQSYRNMLVDVIDFIKSYDFGLIKPVYSRKCTGCSMIDICCPRETCLDDYINDLWRLEDV